MKGVENAQNGGGLEWLEVTPLRLIQVAFEFLQDLWYHRARLVPSCGSMIPYGM